MLGKLVAVGLFVLFTVSGTSSVLLGADDKITVVVDENYFPYSYVTMHQADGLYPKLLEAIFSRMGIAAKIKALPWEKALKAGEDGEAAVGGIYKNNKRLTIYDYSDPLYEENLAVYAIKGKEFDFDSLSDLKGKTLGLNRGWSYGEEFDAARKKFNFTVEESSSNLENFKKLAAGKIDCLVADRIAALRIIQKENLSHQVEQLGKPAAVNHAYLAFAKHLKKQDFLEKFNKTLAEMKKDGSYERLVQGFVTGGSE